MPKPSVHQLFWNASIKNMSKKFDIINIISQSMKLGDSLILVVLYIRGSVVISQ